MIHQSLYVVVVVLGKAPWSCCEELGSLLPELEAHNVHHPMCTGIFALDKTWRID